MHVLLVEDDMELCNAIQIALAGEGCLLDICHTGSEGLSNAMQSQYDVIVLDRMLPVMDGLTILSTLRRQKNATPVLLLTALGSIRDRIEGLDNGADDYLTKPFSLEELSARIRALSRRSCQFFEETLAYSDLHINPKQRILQCNNKQYSLSRRETDLLVYFIRHSGSVIYREAVLQYIWGQDTEVEAGNLDSFVYLLRRKLKNSNSSVRIDTVYGTGYRILPGR